MFSSKKLDQMLEEMKDVSRRDFLLFSAEGELISGTVPEDEMGDAVRQFAASPAETQVLRDWIFFRLEIHSDTEYVLLCSTNGDTDQSYVIGRMALCCTRDLFLTSREPENRFDAIRQILNGDIPQSKVAETCHQLRIKPCSCTLYVIQYKSDAEFVLVETLKNLFANSINDFVIEMDGTRVALIKDMEDLAGMEIKQYAQMIVDNLQSEAMTNVWVGYSNPINSFEELPASYRDACMALKIGMVFYSEDRVFCYHQLGIGRLIYSLPADLCEVFLKEVLGDSMEIDLDEETMVTIRKLFDNNLNISETARQLYIHRNTLVYRLEKVERKLGLDIRSFEDAMLFMIAMMVRVHLNELDVVKK